MNAADRLAQIEARAQAATEGPWTWDAHRVPTLSGRAGDPATYAYDVEVVEAEHSGECGCRSACTLDLHVSPDDAEFIAHARTDVPALTAALRAVLDRHADDGEGFCRCCEFVWPCWTVRDIEEALR